MLIISLWGLYLEGAGIGKLQEFGIGKGLLSVIVGLVTLIIITTVIAMIISFHLSTTASGTINDPGTRTDINTPNSDIINNPGARTQPVT